MVKVVYRGPSPSRLDQNTGTVLKRDEVLDLPKEVAEQLIRQGCCEAVSAAAPKPKRKLKKEDGG